jgi:hypothetical protein
MPDDHWDQIMAEWAWAAEVVKTMALDLESAQLRILSAAATIQAEGA